MLSQRKSLNNYGENFLIPTSGLSTYTPTQIWCMFTYARVHMNVMNTQIQVHMYRMHICLKKEKKRTRVLHNKEKMLLKESKMIVCLFFYSSPVDQKKGPFPNARTSAINLIPQLDIRWLSCIIPNWMVIFRCKSCVLFQGCQFCYLLLQKSQLLAYFVLGRWHVCATGKVRGSLAAVSSLLLHCGPCSWMTQGIRLGSKCLSPEALGQNSHHGASSEHFSPAKTSLQPTVTFLASCFV